MFHRILIAAALAVGAPAIGSAIMPALGIGQAHAQATFTGKIKRVKIRKKRVGSGFKLKVVSQSDADDAAARGSATLRDPNTGEVLGEIELGLPTRGRVRAVGDDDFESLDQGETDTITLTYEAGRVQADGSMGAARETMSVPIELVRTADGRLTGEGVGENGWKARLRTGRDGRPRVVLMQSNRLWAGYGITDLRLTGPGGTSGPLSDIVENAFLGDVEEMDDGATDGVVDILVDVDAALEFRSGNTATASAIIDLSDAAAASSIDKVVTRETRGGEAKLVTVTQGAGVQLAVNLTDEDTGETVIETVDDTPISTVQHFFEEDVQFDGGEDPADFPYLLLIDMIGNDGDPVGQQYEIELTIPRIIIEDDIMLRSVAFGDGLGLVTVARDANGIHFGVGLKDSPEVAAVNLIFEEPFEGPAPLETEVSTRFVTQSSKWVQKGDGALPARFTVETVMTDANGQIIGGASATGTGTGKVAANGKGTRKASSLVRQTIQVALL